MKTLAIISTLLVLPSASLFAQGQSEIEVLRERVATQERRIIQLESTITRLHGTIPQVVLATPSKPSISVVEKTTLPSQAPKATEYIVVKGDSLSRIARKHQTTVKAIKLASGIKSDALRIGQKLQMPSSESTTSTTATSTPSASKKPAVVAQVPSPPTQPSPAARSTAALKPSTYTVKSGDTFYAIARRYNMSEASLQAANPKARPTRLQIGQVLKIHRASTASRVKNAPSPTVVKKTVQSSKSAPQKAVAQKNSMKAPVSSKSSSTKTPTSKREIRTITVYQKMTYGAFASKHGASTSELNSLNGLNLSKSTMLAKGSELYVPEF